jgi:hypothetical protein
MANWHILRRGFWGAMLRLAFRPLWRAAYLGMIASILRNFFYPQFRAVLFPGRVRVTRVDHPLDARIPFRPAHIGIYLDFAPFWIRTQAFLSHAFGRRADPHIARFIRDIGRLYRFAADVYRRNLSTTPRPRYLRHPGFWPLRLFDPHLMCVPSLHIMVVILTYTRLRLTLRELGAEAEYASGLDEVRRRALAISESVLYVKQHSVNCVAAALYAMTRFDPALFPEAEALAFAERLFADAAPTGERPPVAEGDRAAVRDYIIGLYRRFAGEGRDSGTAWEEPLLNFLAALPAAPHPMGN